MTSRNHRDPLPFGEWLFILLLLLLALQLLLQAEWVDAAETRRVILDQRLGPVVKVTVRGCTAQGCGTASGTAVCLGECWAVDRSERYSIWITNAHVARVGQPELSLGGQAATATAFRVETDGDPDLALLQSRALGVRCLCLADRDPRPGEMVTLVGSPGGRAVRRLSGEVTGEGQMETGARIMVAQIASEAGDSGGAIVDAAGRLAGISWGGQGGECHFHPASVIREWMKSRWGLQRCSDCDAIERPLTPEPAEARQEPLPKIDRGVRDEKVGEESGRHSPEAARPPEDHQPKTAQPSIAARAGDLMLWGMSGWQLVTAVAAVAATGGAAMPIAVPAGLRFVRSSIQIVRDIREIKRSRAPATTSPHVPIPVTPAPATEVRGHMPFPRVLDEARELLQLRQTEGRVAALDALRGMALDDAARLILDDESTPEADKLVVRKLLAKIASQVDEIAPISTKGPGT